MSPVAVGQTARKPAAASTQPAAASAQPASPEVAAIRKSLEQKFPGADDQHIAKTDYLGLYEVMLDDSLVYTDPKVDVHLRRRDLRHGDEAPTSPRRARASSTASRSTSCRIELAFKRVKGDGSRKLISSRTPTARSAIGSRTELKGLDNVTIYTFLFPIDQLHPDAARKSKQIWCAPDKVKAWDEFFASGKVPDNKGDCGDPVAKTQALGNSLKINATPTLVFADGTMIPGALPLPQLEKEIAAGEIEAKKLAAAPK